MSKNRFAQKYKIPDNIRGQVWQKFLGCEREIQENRHIFEKIKQNQLIDNVRQMELDFGRTQIPVDKK